MKTTSNYGLKKPDGNDVVNIEDFNYNADIVDRKIKDVETKANSIKVPVTSVNNKTGNVVLAAEDIRTKIGKSVESKFDDITKSIETVKSSKVDKVSGKGLSTQDYTTAEKQKLSAIASGANRYTHPNTHPATIISQDATHRFVSDSEKNNWNGKASRSHRHSSADINQDSSHRFVTDSDKASWSSKANGRHKHSEADLINPSQSIGSAGYRKLPGGLILQWGASSTGSSGQTGTSKSLFYKTIGINLPIAFPHECCYVDASVLSGFIVSNAYPTGGTSKTQITISVGNFGGMTANNNLTVRWFAVGY
ncbi:gp53-like domain-containing protein [Clostridium oceanicum]|uniref:Putative tail fiber protein gp53-like C-terminal domain-containing protein n=1 Tax=Clostridium oceanicum TaxID=1543 RepID=A0ABP3UJY4_9CLOT